MLFFFFKLQQCVLRRLLPNGGETPQLSSCGRCLVWVSGTGRGAPLSSLLRGTWGRMRYCCQPKRKFSWYGLRSVGLVVGGWWNSTSFSLCTVSGVGSTACWCFQMNQCVICGGAISPVCCYRWGAAFVKIPSLFFFLRRSQAIVCLFVLAKEQRRKKKSPCCWWEKDGSFVRGQFDFLFFLSGKISECAKSNFASQKKKTLWVVLWVVWVGFFFSNNSNVFLFSRPLGFFVHSCGN